MCGFDEQESLNLLCESVECDTFCSNCMLDNMNNFRIQYTKHREELISLARGDETEEHF